MACVNGVGLDCFVLLTEPQSKHVRDVQEQRHYWGSAAAGLALFDSTAYNIQLVSEYGRFVAHCELTGDVYELTRGGKADVARDGLHKELAGCTAIGRVHTALLGPYPHTNTEAAAPASSNDATEFIAALPL